MFNIMTGEVIFGGVGAGLYGILLYCILAVFIAGLMVGRTPEYLGKKIEQKEVKMAMLAVIATAFSILVFAALSDRYPAARQRLLESAGSADRQHEQQRPTRLQRDFIRLREQHRQQRQRVRRDHSQHALVQSDHRTGDADRPVPVPDPAAGRRRQPGGAKRRSPPRPEPFPPTARCSSGCWWEPF